MKTVELSVGQAVKWKPSPSGIAQICELRRTRVRIVYRCKNGRMRHAILAAARVATTDPLLFNMPNLFNQAFIKKAKRFKV